ncbi:MAG TPA: Gfo/Idh/MocA family oxidoreductase [Armatimonadota bacterium]|nr:Gfo/Idh/MocA family oxidoreductase [Armatimonadota bacterium]
MAKHLTDRRSFIKTSAGLAAGTLLLPSISRAQGANNRVVVGMVGVGGRGRFLVDRLCERDDVDIAWVCDPDSRRWGGSLDAVEKARGMRPKTTHDLREMLDDSEVDAIVVATPDHWHALPTILGCQAGKDVYVEKPASHNVNEGRKMIEAAEKYGSIVQLGTQNRSAPYVQDAVEYIRDGNIGDVHYARVLNMKTRGTIGHKEDSAPPAEVDYDTWLGPAPDRPFNENRFHYAWHWYWDYSGGDIINDGVHQIDVARWLIGKKAPSSVVCTGGTLFFEDDQETPDTQAAQFDFGDLIMSFELTLWTPYMKKTPWDFRDTDGVPDWRFSATRIEIYGTKGIMFMSRHGVGAQVFDPDGKVVAEFPGRHPHNPHIENFLDCVRTRKAPNAPIDEGHYSTNLCHLANISLRMGGRRLEWDGEEEQFIGDAAANKLLKRRGRKPWIIPDEV